VDMNRLARLVNAPRHRCRMATGDECNTVFGYAPGTFPPCGHRAKFPTYVDGEVARLPPDTVVYAGQGTVVVIRRRCSGGGGGAGGWGGGRG
jgi:prolyl-tRNA editing enzyme YbaK/EbsC (Cys-tRNA(Pro) deacylase)